MALQYTQSGHASLCNDWAICIPCCASDDLRGNNCSARNLAMPSCASNMLFILYTIYMYMCADGTWQNCILPQNVQLNLQLAMPLLASNDRRHWGSTGCRPVRKKNSKVGLFFLVPTRCFIRKVVNPMFPILKGLSIVHIWRYCCKTKLCVGRHRSWCFFVSTCRTLGL